jgi:lysozyme family protein
MTFPKLTYEEYEAGGLDAYDFYKIHNGFTAIIEAGWVKDPKDKGGETLFGISRKAHPDWVMWKKVDAAAQRYPRGSAGFKKLVESDKEIFMSAARIFYADYYMPVRGDQTIQEVAMVMYDLAVHAGIKRSVKMAQRTINKMHGKKTLLDDGKLGNLTLKELLKLTSVQAVEFAKEYLQLRLAWHIAANPEYTKGFTRRVHDLWRFIFEDEM